jgi:hypothetical protein
MANDKDKSYEDLYSDAVKLSIQANTIMKDDEELSQINLRMIAVVDYISKARMRKITGIKDNDQE